ncbi:MAG: DUF721 domain-containing protein [Acidimicrobiales bacterium]
MPWSPLPNPDADGAAPRRLGDALDTVLRGLGSPPADALASLHARWEDIVGPAAAVTCRPRTIEHGTLIVDTAIAGWASQLRWQAPDVVERATTVLGPGVVERVEIRVRRG